MKKLANGYKVLTDISLMDYTKSGLISKIRELESMLECSLGEKQPATEKKKTLRGYNNFFSGKVDLDKLIAFHERESQLGHLRDNFEREEWHYKAVRLLECFKK